MLRLHVAVGLLLAALLLAGCASTAPQTGREAALDSYVQAVLAYQSGDRARAIAALQASISKDGKVTLAHSMLGDLYRDDRDYSGAATQYEVVTVLDPYSEANHYKLGLMYQLMRRLPEAVKSYSRALTLKSDDFDANLNLAMAYLAEDQAAKALPYARHATQLRPRSAPAWANLGVVLDAVKQLPDAEEAYTKALELDSDQTQTAMYLAENLLRQQKYPAAHSVMAQVLRQQPRMPMAHKLCGDTLFLQHQFPQAISEYQAALALDPRFYRAMNELGWLLITQYQEGMELDESRRSAAIEYWRSSLRINPDQPRIQDLLQKYSSNELFTR